MALRQGGVDSEPIRMYEATPKAVASNIIFLAAWLVGTIGSFLVCTTLPIDIDGIYTQEYPAEHFCHDLCSVYPVAPLPWAGNHCSIASKCARADFPPFPASQTNDTTPIALL